VLRYLHFLRSLFSRYFFGFLQDYSFIDRSDLINLHHLVDSSSEHITRDFECRFSKLIGSGQSVSFASGRMAFFSLLQALNVKSGDEVLLTGFTCSVMSNAILRIGATPIYSDIDLISFGSDLESIKKNCSIKTKLIVIQHSFGIPCDVQPIANFASQNNIFLLEDCALTVGSSIDGIVCGNFGDAALFSTDHTKPISTLTGGLIYSSNLTLISKVRDIQQSSPELSSQKKNALYRQLLKESRFCNIHFYSWFKFYSIVKHKFFPNTNPFLVNDFSPYSHSQYPYPAKMPSFLAALGILYLNHWPKLVVQRKANLKLLLSELKKVWPNSFLIYSDPRLDIIPLRLVFCSDNGVLARNKISSFVDVSYFWFLKPIVATNFPLKQFHYIEGSCVNSEMIGRKIINIPCIFSHVETQLLLKLILNKFKSGADNDSH